jgi:benzoyl-CoA reductase subunit B
LLDKYILADGTIVDGYPTPDFIWQDHICCSHGKWYQIVKWLEKKRKKEVPMYCVDVSVGYPTGPVEDYKLNYIVQQLNDGIEWLEKTTGRTYNEKLLEEVKDRVKRGIAATPYERFRVITDTQPPWAFLKIFREMEKYGAVSLGSLYTFGLIGMWEYKPDGELAPKPLPPKKPQTREEALRMIVEWTLYKPEWAHFYVPEVKTQMMKSIVKQWKVNAVLLHYNRGCEGLSLHIAENRFGLVQAGIPVFPFEGNMGDERDFDFAGTLARLTAFFESMGLKKLKE